MTSPRVESFLVRVVVDDGDPLHQSCHGRVQHVSSGREQQFAHFQEMLAFISSQLSGEAQTRSPEPPLSYE